ncbi:MAG TPA: four-carbon acid sugar kinase family protein [Geminicoccaceae bacterium]
MPEVRILADDLTGALDAAAPFAAASEPLPVLWPPAPPPGRGRFAYDSESRDGGDIRALIEALSGPGLAFKKIDSLLRGSTIDEIRACVASGLFPSVVIAPAFPAQHRITRGGRQLFRRGHAWPEVPADLHAVVEHASALRRTEAARGLEGRGVFLCDASTDDDLEAIAAAAPALAAPVLWVGTGGLAFALAGAGGRPAPPSGPLLIVVGSHHPMTLIQVDALTRARPELVVRIEPGAAVEPAVDAVAGRLGRRGLAALVFGFPDGTGAEVAGPVFDAAFALLAERLARPGSMLVTGGSTLYRLVRALGADALRVEGEWQPGIPISTLTGSPWDGTRIVSKSGGFGADIVLLQLVREIEEVRP